MAAAEVLIEHGYPAYAVHFSIICWEECSKFLLVYCKDHLPNTVFRSRYAHASKLALANSLYFLTGSLSVIYGMQKIHQAGYFKEVSEAFSALILLMIKRVGWGNPEGLAQTIMDSFNAERTQEQNEALVAHVRRTESLRTRSVYVDVKADLDLEGSPNQIQQGEIDQWLENGRVGLAVLNFLRSPNSDLATLVAGMPPKMKAVLERDAADFLSHMQSGVDQKRTESS